VQIVVAAGWAVDDRAAEAFAAAFYTSLLEGRDYGDAVREARSAAHDRSSSLTWGAYQCYGDPGYRLTLRGGGPSRPSLIPVGRSELIRELQTIAVRAADVGRPDTGELDYRRNQLLSTLASLEANADEHWLDAEVGYEFGNAYAKLGDNDYAVDWFRKARADGRPYPSVLFEQLANREIRLAQEIANGSGRTNDRRVADVPKELVTQARRHLKEAASLPPTVDRTAIAASLDKKAATLAPPAQRAQLLAKAARSYRAAYDINKRATIGNPATRRDSYPALNWLQLASLAGTWPPTDKTLIDNLYEIRRWLDEAPQKLRSRPRHDRRSTPDFWTSAQAGDLALTSMLITPNGKGISDQSILDVANGYLAAFGTRSNWGDRSSVLEHLRDVRTLAQGADDLVNAIDQVIERLDTWEHEHITHRQSAADVSSTRSGRPSQAGPGLQIEMLPARHGDCIWVQYGNPPATHRMVIDGGPGDTYPLALGERLTSLPEDDRRFDLLVITHIDTDHIDGGLRAIRERNVHFDDIWFNGWKHLTDTDRGPQQGAILDALLDGRTWNAAFAGAPIVVGDQMSSLPTARLPGDALVTILSPGPTQLEALQSTWAATLKKNHITPGSAEEALRLLDERDPEYAPLERGAKRKRVFGNDHSPANGSSIAFLFEWDALSCLFAGDAHAPVLVDSLRRLLAERGDERLKLDVFKLSHHGSMSNITDELLGLVDCDRFLVSTNGDTYHHPDAETIELIGRHRNTRPTVYFNYVSDTTTPWQSPDEQRRVNIEARHPSTGAGITLAL
jgi:beta-lactamase superfamily II metal-dependent hydrolase/tetratricopeptide (TPR) repeat protein